MARMKLGLCGCVVLAAWGVLASCAGGGESDNPPGKGGKAGNDSGSDSATGGADGSAASGGTGGSTGGSDAGDGSSGTGGNADAGDGGCLREELCDGLDNTCDNDIDEGCACIEGQTQECYSGDVNLVGIGECVKGEQSCDIDGVWGPCVNEVLPVNETCDAKDNDCNGQTDEGLGDTTCGQGICTVTIDACEGGATQNCVPNPPNPGGETCDGTDDDCDGTVDEGCTCLNGQTQGCYTADPATKDIGVCKGGTQLCQNGAWAACTGEVTPSSETCDAKDNDCDGAADEGNPESGGSCNTGEPGVCSVGSLNCQNGALVCTQTVQPSAEQCDGIDNDCDGATDENNPGGGGTCNSGQPGVCAAGTLNCQSANLVCVPNETPSPEACNGADDDCDNVVDDGTNPCGGACALSGNPGAPCDGPDGDACQEGSWLCGGINTVVCTDSSTTNTESCNGADDDCDGTTDEGNNPCGGVCTLAQSPGSACDGPDADQCDEGTWACSGLNNTVCSDATSSNNEACNGLDDDCDGDTDEGNNACGGVCTLPQTPGSACDGPDADQCAEGTWTCSGTNNVTCSDTSGNSTETCNGQDDDCDGQTDEGTNGCGGICTLPQALGTGCDGSDGDLCNEGTWVCNGTNDVACSDNTGTLPELCDGLDNDCNPATTAPGGEGNADGDPALACNDCADNDPARYPGNPEICDGKDNDCNSATSAPGGEGNNDGDPSLACADCNDNNPAIYPGATEVCDGIDNNCNSLVDTAEVPVATLCGTPANGVAQCSGPLGCVIASCNTNFYNTNGTFSDGCECLVAPAPVATGDTCALAVNLGTLADSSAASVLQSGNSPVAGRDVWYRFTASDDLDTAGDEFHVDVRFSNNPANQYRMEVYRTACPGAAGSETLATAETWTSWFTDQPYTTSGCTGPAPCGEGNCTNAPSLTANLCEDRSAVFFVRIYQVNGIATCSQYTAEFSNGKY
jgi:hypothetical protein